MALKTTHPGGLLPRTEGSSLLFSAAVLCTISSAIESLDPRDRPSSVLMVRFEDGMVAFDLYSCQGSRFVPRHWWKKKAQTRAHAQVAAASLQAGIDMHSFLRRLYFVLHAQSVVVAGDVVSCSLPVAACSSFARRHVVCGYAQIVGCGMFPFCHTNSDGLAWLSTRNAAPIFAWMRDDYQHLEAW